MKFVSRPIKIMMASIKGKVELPNPKSNALKINYQNIKS